MRVSLVGVLARELVAQKMAAIEQVLALHEIVLGHLPAGGAHLADGTALLRGLGLGERLVGWILSRSVHQRICWFGLGVALCR